MCNIHESAEITLQVGTTHNCVKSLSYSMKMRQLENEENADKMTKSRKLRIFPTKIYQATGKQTNLFDDPPFSWNPHFFQSSNI